MPKFRVEQYERHVTTYDIEADDKADAISKILDGNGSIVTTQYLETDETRGMPVDYLTVAEARKLNVVHDKFVPTIRTIEEI